MQAFLSYAKFQEYYKGVVILQDRLFKWVSIHVNVSRVMRNTTFCICKNKDADQLRRDGEADQRLCFRYIDSTIPLLSKSKISSL